MFLVIIPTNNLSLAISSSISGVKLQSEAGFERSWRDCNLILYRRVLTRLLSELTSDDKCRLSLDSRRLCAFDECGVEAIKGFMRHIYSKISKY